MGIHSPWPIPCVACRYISDFHLGRCLVRRVAHHLVVQPVSEDKLVRYLHAVRFHGMRWPIVKLTHLWIVKVCNSLLRNGARHCLLHKSLFPSSEMREGAERCRKGASFGIREFPRIFSFLHKKRIYKDIWELINSCELGVFRF